MDDARSSGGFASFTRTWSSIPTSRATTNAPMATELHLTSERLQHLCALVCVSRSLSPLCRCAGGGRCTAVSCCCGGGARQVLLQPFAEHHAEGGGYSSQMCVKIADVRALWGSNLDSGCAGTLLSGGLLSPLASAVVGSAVLRTVRFGHGDRIWYAYRRSGRWPDAHAHAGLAILVCAPVTPTLVVHSISDSRAFECVRLQDVS